METANGTHALTMVEADPQSSLVLTEQVKLAYGGAVRDVPSTVYANLLAAGIFVLVMRDVVSQVHLSLWLAAQVSYQILRIVLFRIYWRVERGPIQAPRWAKLFALQTSLNGTIWGLAGVIFFSPQSIPHQSILAVLLCGLAAGSIPVTAMLMPAFVGSAGMILGLFIGRVVFEGDSVHLELGGLLTLYLVFVLGWGRSLNRMITSSLRQRFANIELVRQLQEQTRVAETAKDAAIQADRAKSRFLAAASHDLRQPLHALALFSQALVEQNDPAKMRDLAQHIGTSVSAMSALFNALLDISRLDAGIVQPKPTHFAIDQMFDRLRNDFAPLAQRKRLNLRIRHASAAAFTDPILLEQVIRNLISNAIRYTDKGGVLVACRRRGDQWAIEVCDTGIGIAPEEHNRIFAEFYQIGNTERDRQKGLGLGLAIVQRMSQLLEISVSLRSQPGRGTRFIVRVPGGTLPKKEKSNEMTELLGFHGLRVLVIDDELEIRIGMEALLGGWGCDVVAAESLIAAMGPIAERHWEPEIAISDYRLRQGENGIEVLDWLRTHFHTSLPCLLMTGDIEATRLAEVEQRGYPMLHKPIPPSKLRALLRSLATTAHS